MNDNGVFILRLLICLLLSLLIGYERESKSNISLKLNILVCLGAYLFVSIAVRSVEVGAARIAAQIVSGVSFLGTGAIIINNNELKGLNTAATMWCITAIGMLTGFGFIFDYNICYLIITILIYLYFFKRNYNRLMKEKNKELLQVKVLGSLFLICGALCLLYFQVNDKGNFIGSVAI